MTSNHGIDNNALQHKLCQESDFSAGTSLNFLDSPARRNEWKKNRFSSRSYIIGKAYDEPYDCRMVENILLGRHFIID